MKIIVFFLALCAPLASAWAEDPAADTSSILAERQAAYSQVYQSILADPSQSAFDVQKAGQQAMQSVNEKTDALVRKRQEERDNYLYKNVFYSDGRVLPRNGSGVPAIEASSDEAAPLGGPRAPASRPENYSFAPEATAVDGSKVPKEIEFPGPKRAAGAPKESQSR
jgi:hypothetical protein